MANREVRLSPDGNSIAIRTDWPADAWNAWGVMDANNGGHWAKSEEIAEWRPATGFSDSAAPESTPEPEVTIPPVEPGE